MLKYVKKFIEENNLNGKTVLIGLSGGVDSSVLLDILSKMPVCLVAIHLNHNWRGDESKRDEQFAKNLANKYNVEFYGETLDENTKHNEVNARILRYDFFARCKEKFSADAVFLAHNKNDNVETLLYRLIKGTGTKGLNSISKIRDFYYRPLIDFTREDIEKYAQNNNLEFISDSSNMDCKYKRNLIRHKILPLMKEINPDVVNSISTFIKINRENQKITDSVIDKAKSEIYFEDKILRNKFLELNESIQFELINRILTGLAKNRDYKTTKKIVDFIKNNYSSKISINKKLFLKIYDNKIYFITSSPQVKALEVPLKIGENIYSNYKITVEKSQIPPQFPPNGSFVSYIKLDFKNNYILRTRKQGDIIQTFNAKNNIKLKTFLIKAKVPAELRDELPLITLGDEVLYVPFYMTGEKLRVDKSDEFCYKITVERC